MASLTLWAERMAFVLLSPSTGCPTKRAQSILWENAGEYLSSKDVHRPNTGSCPAPPEPGQQGWPG